MSKVREIINNCYGGCYYQQVMECWHPKNKNALIPLYGIHPDCPLPDYVDVGEMVAVIDGIVNTNRNLTIVGIQDELRAILAKIEGE